MTPLQLLKKARALLAKPKAWIQGSEARTANGTSVCATTRGAIRFCALGALYKAEGVNPMDSGDRDVARWALRRAVKNDHLVSWNDAPRRTHAQILKGFDKAIASLERK